MSWGGGSRIFERMLTSIDQVDASIHCKKLLLQDLIKALEMEDWQDFGEQDFEELPAWAKDLAFKLRPHWTPF